MDNWFVAITHYDSNDKQKEKKKKKKNHQKNPTTQLFP